jgi:hypothetical protein
MDWVVGRVVGATAAKVPERIDSMSVVLPALSRPRSSIFVDGLDWEGLNHENSFRSQSRRNISEQGTFDKFTAAEIGFPTAPAEARPGISLMSGLKNGKVRLNRRSAAAQWDDRHPTRLVGDQSDIVRRFGRISVSACQALVDSFLPVDWHNASGIIPETLLR